MDTTYYNIRKELHRCASCGTQDERTLAGYALCNTCIEKQKQYQRQYKQKLKEQHRCVLCGKQDEQTLAGKVRCEFCSKKLKLLYRENKSRKMNERAEK